MFGRSTVLRLHRCTQISACKQVISKECQAYWFASWLLGKQFSKIAIYSACDVCLLKTDSTTNAVPDALRTVYVNMPHELVHNTAAKQHTVNGLIYNCTCWSRGHHRSQLGVYQTVERHYNCERSRVWPGVWDGCGLPAGQAHQPAATQAIECAF